MSYRTLRRRLSEAVAAHDWLEGLSTALGIAFLVLTAVCVWALVITISTLGDRDATFQSTPGFLQGIRGLGIVLFAVVGFIAASAGWFFAGDAVRHVWRRLRGRG